jgi:hypothetical protein
MPAVIIKSNHGNHCGYNRKWKILGGNVYQSRDEAMEHLADIANELEETYPPELRNDHVLIDAFEYDLYYYYVIDEFDVLSGMFNGEHMGYIPNELVNLLKLPDVEPY